MKSELLSKILSEVTPEIKDKVEVKSNEILKQNNMTDLERAVQLLYETRSLVAILREENRTKQLQELDSVPRESTLDNGMHLITDKRRDGNSTRLADHAISIIMSGKVCIIENHKLKKNQEPSDSILFDRVLNRLKTEFPQYEDSILSDSTTKQIYLKLNK